MKSLLSIALIVTVGTLTGYAAPQAAAIQNLQISAQVITIPIEGAVTYLSGRVVVKAGDVTVEADEVDVHRDTREIEARGNVVVRTILAESAGPIASYDSTLTALRQQLAELRRVFIDSHPSVIVVQAKIAELETARSVESANIAGRFLASSAWSLKVDGIKMQLPQSAR